MFTEEERERIIAEARANLDPIKRDQEQAELAQRLMQDPIADPVAAWRAKGDASKERRAAVKRAMRTQQVNEAAVAANNTADWESWAHHKLLAERDFLIQVCGNAIGELTGELHKEFLSKIDEQARAHACTQSMYEAELKQNHEYVKALKKLHIQELALMNTRMTALEHQLTQLEAKLQHVVQAAQSVNSQRGLKLCEVSLHRSKRSLTRECLLARHTLGFSPAIATACAGPRCPLCQNPALACRQ
jgi:polyhydroxyalkanoate synthesis regulator phasin